MEKKIATSASAPTGNPAGIWLRGAGARPESSAPAGTDRTDGDFAPRDLRKKIPYVALINYGLTYSMPWHVHDLSPSGALVEMDATDLKEGAYVEFVLRFHYKGRSIEHRIPARVMRISTAGVALKFGEYPDAAYTDLVNLLYAM